jgi:integrase
MTSPSDYPEAEDRQRILKACRASDDPQLYPFVVMLLSTACRAGEVLQLRWGDIDFERGLAHVTRTKNGKPKVLPVTGHAADLLTAIQSERKPERLDRVFLSKRASQYRYAESWKAAATAAGWPQLRVHDLRHIAASEMAMAGASQPELSALLGHSDPRMALRYSHFLDRHLAELGGRLSDRLFPS